MTLIRQVLDLGYHRALLPAFLLALLEQAVDEGAAEFGAGHD
jgi:hypothetical protein